MDSTIHLLNNWGQIIMRGTNCMYPLQCAKKVLSDSPGLGDFAIGLVNFVFNLPDGLVIFFLRYSNNRIKNCEINSPSQKVLEAS